MRLSTTKWLVIILVMVGIAAWVDWPADRTIDVFGISKDIRVHEGLDLQGGMQVLLQANWPEGTQPDGDKLEAAKMIVEQRVNGLGVVEPLVQRQGDSRIIVELPGIKDPDKAIAAFGETGLLEFIDAGATYLPEGTTVKTTYGGPSATPSALDPSGEAATGAGEAVGAEEERVFETIITGADLESSEVAFDQIGAPMVSFKLKSEGGQKFAEFTTNNVGRYLAIVVDKKVISSPTVRSPITGGSGVIEGVNLEEARKIVLQLKYGALPVSLEVVQNRTVGPTLGQDSIQESIIAGGIGLGLVLAFMIAYYRLPGVLADVSLLIYTAFVFALFKVIPVTLTLAGIAGFILSIGMAVDANILIFARLKEELRAGRTLGAAVDAGFKHAWPSIRDSNISTMITCVILFWFGSVMGISIIMGFAITLGLGVAVSMFTAITVTRNFLKAMQRWLLPPGAKLTSRHLWLFGLDKAPGDAGVAAGVSQAKSV